MEISSLSPPHKSLPNRSINRNNNAPPSNEVISALSYTAEVEARLAHLTDTELKCFISPPNKNVVNMDQVTIILFNNYVYNIFQFIVYILQLMGFWTVVRKVNSTEGTDDRYMCEEVIYTKTGPNTFNKVSDVHL